MQNDRKLYARIFLTILLGMVISMGLVRAFALANNASGSRFLERELMAMEALPRILEQDGNRVLFYGSSMTQAGFSARHFDRHMAQMGADTSSWNFGFGGLNPYFQDFLSRRIREQVEAEGGKFDLVLIEFNPFQTTQARWNGALPIVDSFLTILASNEELWGIAKDDPERGALLFNIKYFRDGVSAEAATTFLGGMFDEPPELSDRPGLPEEDQARFDEISETLNTRFEEEYPDWNGDAWNWDWQGAGTVPWERPEETVDMFPEFYALMNADEQRMHNALLNRIRSADILELNFEPLLVDAFIATVNNFKPIAERVEIVMLPRNTDWVTYTPEVQARLDAVVARIEAETGVPVRNHQDVPELRGQLMFSDATHLARYMGDTPYTEYLAEQYADYFTK